MNTFKLISILWILLIFQKPSEALERCVDQSEQEECSDTEYHSYVECMRKREKREIDCDPGCNNNDCSGSTECNECDCNYCNYNECSSPCDSCCERSPPPCQNRACCQQTCHSQCRTTSCRRSCRSRCQSKLTNERTIISGGGGLTNISNKVNTDSKHNITTIINLHNVINNTNIIDMPINLNNTNINNITLEAPEAPQGSNVHLVHTSHSQQMQPQIQQQQQQQQDNCCKIIGPRQCMPIQAYPFSKCFHYRKEHCGDLCRTSIMHAEPHEVCDQVGDSPSCHKQVVYIPQPQPRCTYTTQWPYVQCNIQNMQNANCGGCYSHLLKGGQPPNNCPSSCYDGGYNVGPLYRQGPYYQPSYQPVPPCAYTGNCEGNMGNIPQMQQMQQMYQPGNPYENYAQIELPNNVYQYGAQNIDPNLIGTEYRTGENLEHIPRLKKEAEEKTTDKES